MRYSRYGWATGDEMNETLGYIGLGIMGRPMALNLLRAGYSVTVWARRPSALDPLLTAGAALADSPAAVAARSGIVFTNLSDTADVEEVVLGPLGIVHGAGPGSVVVDHSTISAIATRTLAGQLATRGIAFLDAPVSGGEQGAVDGSLSIMVGGTAEAFARVRPLLARVGRNIVHVGASGAGQIAKACNQVVIAQTIAAVGEAFILARAAGVDPGKVREALLGGFAQSRVLEAHGQRMLDGNYRPGFKARLHQKDMRIVAETAHTLGVALPGAALVGQYLNALIGGGSGELDSAAIHCIQQMLTRPLPDGSGGCHGTGG
jgi:2-hydroxy-3-oxopropionate reductase